MELDMSLSDFDLLCLSDVSTYVNEKVKSTELSTGTYVSTENMLPNKAGLIDAIKVSDGRHTRFNINDVLVSNIRPYFKKIWFADKVGGCSTDVLVFRNNKKITPKYLYYSLLDDRFFNYMMSGSKGTKMPRGDKAHIMDYELLVPNLNKQVSITSILTPFDDKIDLNNKINSNLEELAQTLYKHWFVDFEFPNEEGKPYKSSGGEMVESELGMIPRGWKVMTLDQLSSETKNSIVDGPFGTQLKIAEYVDSGIPVVEMNQLNGYENTLGYKNFITLDKFEKIKRSTVIPGDIIISKTGTLGLLGTISRDYDKVILVSRLAKITPNYNIIGSNTLLIMMHYLSKSGYWYQIASGSTMPLLNLGNIKNTKVVFTESEFSKKFEDYVSSIIDKINNNSREIVQLTSLRDLLLPKLMSGEIKV